MEILNLGKIFNKVFNNETNFMTPTVIKYGKTKSGLIYELSKGKGFYDNDIYGVTVLKLNEYEKYEKTDLNKMFDTSLKNANKYIEDLV